MLGTKDDTLGESVVAIIALKSAVLDPDVFLIDLKAHLKSRLATYKQPRVYKLIESIPRNHMGKVIRFKI